jgi:hypothetical protein
MVTLAAFRAGRSANLQSSEFAPSSASSRSEGIMKWLWTALLTAFGIISAQAYTCADVRTLSLEQQAYYIRVFSIMPAQ